jgi:putative tricarboxylic transport membrane protein
VTDHLLEALQVLYTWPNPLYVIGGVLFGMLIGFLPGMAGSVALALLIPLSFQMEPEVAVLFLISAYSPAGFGGMLTSILVNTPGAPENAATTFDGYPLAKQGRAGAAIGAATAASVLGGLFGAVVLVALIPVAQRFVLSFSYPEFLMMAVFGLTTIAVVTDRNSYKGLIAAGLGFMAAFVGLDPIVGGERFTFGSFYLTDGVATVPVLIGLFAGAEVLALYGRNATVAADVIDVDGTPVERSISGPVTFWQGIVEAFRHKWLVVRCSLIGTVVGVVPGVGGAVSGFVAYSHARQTSRNPELFGKGAFDGVIAAESANDAKEGGSFLPTIAFGIPGTIGMAVLLGALILQGVPAGPTLLIDHIDIVYVLVLGLVMAKLIAPVVVWLVAKQSTRLTRVRPGVFTPLIVVAALVGTYTVGLQILDVAVAVLFGYVGYAMRRYGFSRVALIIAFVLGELVERAYYQTLGAFGDVSVIFRRPISALLLALTALVLGFAVVKAIKRMRAPIPDEDDPDVLPSDRLQPGRVFFGVLALGLTILLVRSATGITSDARVMPLLIGVPLICALALQLLVDVAPGPVMRLTRPLRRQRPEETAGPGPAGVEPAVPPGTPTDETTEYEVSGRGVLTAETPREGLQAEYTGRPMLARQAAFAAWSCAFVLLAAFTGFLVAIPLALLFFFAVLAKERLVPSVVIAVVATAVIYALFGLALDINLGV